MRRTVLLSLLSALVVALTASVALAKASFPEVIALPNGWQPEGIAIGNGTTFYVGSIPTGAVYRGDLRTGKGATLVPGAPGRAAIGVQHDRGRLFVAGGATGKGFVYDARSGSLLRELQLATGAGATFVNDVVVTKRAAYFTDSNRAVLYRVALSANGVPAASSRAIPLTGDFQLVAGFNLNGIDATPDGKTLVVVQSATGTLFTVDAATGTTREIGLGGASVPNGDGLLLHGRTLYVVQNQLNRIAVVSLAKGFDSGRITRTIVDPDLDVPTTVDRFGDRLYAVNARFGTAPGPSTSYSVVQLRR
jgi:sugar lactone lactonase YvrE